MIQRRPFERLGRLQRSRLDSHRHFSFGDYYDPERLGWGALRVWNDDVIEPGSGFALHSLPYMEIITYVREGAITHEDSLGNRGRTKAGDVLVMSADAGAQHRARNLEAGAARIFQIWILPDDSSAELDSRERLFSQGECDECFVPLASGFVDDEALSIRADARVAGASLRPGESACYIFADARLGYLVVDKGAITANGISLKPGDGAALRDETILHVNAWEEASLVVVDVGREPPSTRHRGRLPNMFSQAYGLSRS